MPNQGGSTSGWKASALCQMPLCLMRYYPQSPSLAVWAMLGSSLAFLTFLCFFQILMVNKITRPIQIKEFASTMLFVHVQKGKQLRLNNSEEKPTARVELKIRDAKRKTKFRVDTRSPEWKQRFSFPLKDPRNEVLEVLVKDKANGQMGTMAVPLSNLITAQGLTMEGWLKLHPTEPCGAVWIKLELRILVPPNSGAEFVDS
ncbi:extended synaptotagmin-1-like [Xenopus tropicalis]|uniref:Extended synaptotagmin-1-like n=1 Tax=Xenopus tropicalis TaxID=8364 RepID=A0A8J1IX11_XENTR|nr:extended synaptotagmin-1-like [Xenopus tropicalis]XP_031750148.1 extended synaptotagmin-1-like [Xenopus tropicalis]